MTLIRCFSKQNPWREGKRGSRYRLLPSDSPKHVGGHSVSRLSRRRRAPAKLRRGLERFSGKRRRKTRRRWDALFKCQAVQQSECHSCRGMLGCPWPFLGAALALHSPHPKWVSPPLCGRAPAPVKFLIQKVGCVLCPLAPLALPCDEQKAAFCWQHVLRWGWEELPAHLLLA